MEFSDFHPLLPCAVPPGTDAIYGFLIESPQFLWIYVLLKLFVLQELPYEKELYQNICDIYLKYIAHICKLYLFTMSVYVSYMYMLHICRIRSNIYVTYM